MQNETETLLMTGIVYDYTTLILGKDGMLWKCVIIYYSLMPVYQRISEKSGDGTGLHRLYY